jgi:hypothetical protein
LMKKARAARRVIQLPVTRRQQHESHLRAPTGKISKPITGVLSDLVLAGVSLAFVVDKVGS